MSGLAFSARLSQAVSLLAKYLFAVIKALTNSWRRAVWLLRKSVFTMSPGTAGGWSFANVVELTIMNRFGTAESAGRFCVVVTVASRDPCNNPATRAWGVLTGTQF